MGRAGNASFQDAARGLGGRCLPALVVLLPFEPRRPSLGLFGLTFTLLEAAAAVLGGALLWTVRGRLPALLRRPPLPLAFLGLYAAAHVLSVVFAPAHRDLAAKFALRMLVMAGLAAAVAASPPEAGRRALVALVASAAAVAVLAVAEGAGWERLDPFLSLFREMPFNIGGSRRASGASEYPNLAAALLMAGMLAACGLASEWRRPLAALLPLAVLFSAALLWTYSRGALVATGLGLVALAGAGWRRRRLAAPAFGGLAVLLAASAAFAWSGDVYRLRLEAEGAASWYGAAYGPVETALTLRPGETRTTDIRVTNTGQLTWGADRLFHLSYHWYDRAGRKVEDGRRTRLPRDIGPGDTVVLRAEVRAPAAAGRFLLGWDMVQERVAWFSERSVAQAMVGVEVAGAPIDASAVAPSAPVVGIASAPMPAPPPQWHPGRAELWRLAFVLWRRRPLTGVGSDNFRWLYGEAAGQPAWDTRVFANNALIEAAATTGALGLVALAGTLAASVLAAGKAVLGPASGGVAAALFALTIGLAAHGMVDYVLAFTGHYLLFAFVVGSVAGQSRAEGLP
jgi:hypothetical protein